MKYAREFITSTVVGHQLHLSLGFGIERPRGSDAQRIMASRTRGTSRHGPVDRVSH
jgi:hypothetical protein